MIIGITATQYGLTTKQKDELRSVLRWFYRGGLRFEAHHGLCVGGDIDAHRILREVFAKDVTIHGWPAKNVGNKSMASVMAHDIDVMHAPMPPLDRDDKIVLASEVMVGLPQQRAEEQRSGTWHTLRYARQLGKLTVMVWP